MSDCIAAGVTNKQVSPPVIKEKLGFGIGLRNRHFEHILKEKPDVDWFEAISENFMDSGGRPIHVLREIAENYPIVLHGVSMSIGSTDPLNMDYLQHLKTLANDISAKWVSDHLCWTGVLGYNSHDLLPLPLNEISLNHVVSRIHKVQEVLGRRLVLENPSSYLRFKNSDISEPDFLKELCRQTDCQLLLDVNNVYVSCFNAGTNPQDYLKDFPFESVIQMHLAGHEHCGTHIIDTHDKPVCNEVWKLFQQAWQRCDGISTLLEWDGDIPEFERLQEEIQIAKDLVNGITPLSAIANTYETEKISANVSTPVDFMVPEVMDRSHYVAK